MRSLNILSSLVLTGLLGACGDSPTPHRSAPPASQPAISAPTQTQCLASAPAASCEAMDASLHDPSCDTFWGYRWDGQACEYLGGSCECVGADCGSLFSTETECEAAYAACAAESTVEVTVSDDTIRVTDHQAVFNCCLDAWMEVSIDDHHIVVVEVEDPDDTNACDCECVYELSVAVSQLSSGDYTVSVYRGAAVEAALLHETTVTVQPTSDIQISDTQQSACLGSPDSAPDGDASVSSVEVAVGPGEAIITDHALEGNCCLQYEMEVTVDADRIVVVETEQPGEPCDCICVYEVSVAVSSLPPGPYAVEVYWSRVAPETQIHVESVVVP